MARCAWSEEDAGIAPIVFGKTVFYHRNCFERRAEVLGTRMVDIGDAAPTVILTARYTAQSKKGAVSTKTDPPADRK